jgi:hypothetical protein
MASTSSWQAPARSTTLDHVLALRRPPGPVPSRPTGRARTRSTTHALSPARLQRLGQAKMARLARRECALATNDDLITLNA